MTDIKVKPCVSVTIGTIEAHQEVELPIVDAEYIDPKPDYGGTCLFDEMYLFY